MKRTASEPGLKGLTEFCGRVCFARDEVLVFAAIVAMLSVTPSSRAPAVTSLSRFPVQPAGKTRGVLKGNSAEQYCLSIILSAAIAFVEVRNICTDTRDTSNCLCTRCTHSLQVSALFSYQLSSMLTLMFLLACFC